jgi:hypothetical protein
MKKKRWEVSYDDTIAGTIIVPADNAEDSMKIVEKMLHRGKLGLPRRKSEHNESVNVGDDPKLIGEGE